MALIQVVLGILICGLAFRAWGTAKIPKLVAIFLATMGFIISNPQELIFAPAIILFFWFFRVFATGPSWLANTRGENLKGGFIRGLAILPLAILGAIYFENYLGFIFIAPAIFYLIAGKLSHKNCVEIAEILTGFFFGLCALSLR